MSQFKILILGATGMLGSQLFTYLHTRSKFSVYATVRNREARQSLPADLSKQIIDGVSAENMDTVTQTVTGIQPDLVINCIGIIKQISAAKDPIQSILINALFPQRLAKICAENGIKLIHISTDCVFDGKKGNYTEFDLPSPPDLYGRTKLLGEVTCTHCLTLRTSIIGHELHSNYGLVEWFLTQTDTVKGLTKTIYSGLTTVELSRIIADYIIPHPELTGLYHVSSNPISKYDLLNLIKNTYHHKVAIEADDTLKIDRSLNSDLFKKVTGYVALPWPEMIDVMYRDYNSSPLYQKFVKGDIIHD